MFADGHSSSLARRGRLQAAPRPAPALHPNLTEVYRQRVTDLLGALAARRGTYALERVRGKRRPVAAYRSVWARGTLPLLV
jgi:hypothetical protein